MPTPSAGRPRQPENLEGTLKGNFAGVDLSQVDPFFAQLADNLPEPDLAPVPKKAGIPALLLSSLSAGFTGDTDASADLINLQQERIAEATETNRKLETQHKNTQIDLLLAGRKELTRKLELEGKNSAAERERIRAARLAAARENTSNMDAITRRMKLKHEVKEDLSGVENDLIGMADHMAAQMEDWALDAEDAFARGEAAPPFLIQSLPDNNGNIQTFHTPEAIDQALEAAIDGASKIALTEEDVLAIFQHLQGQKERFLGAGFKAHKAVVDKYLKRTQDKETEVKRKTGIADRKRAAEEGVEGSTVTQTEPEFVPPVLQGIVPSQVPIPKVLRTPQQAGRAISATRRK